MSQNRWFIAYKERPASLFDISGLKIIEAPKGHYYADPFLAEHEGKHYLFFEDYDYEKGCIAVGELDDSGLSNIHVIIEEPNHLSFPSVFKEGDTWYMAPERCLSGELAIYKALDFPYEWGKVSCVANGRFDDPVIRKVADGYEVWCSTDGDKLRVYKSPVLETGMDMWALVRSEDMRFARSAGNFIGDIRPVQDSIPIYGRAVRFFDGKDLLTIAIEPDWFPELTGTHTFNVDNKYLVVDGRVQLKT